MRKIFVTGATGFIGSNLVRILTQQGFHVCALIREGSSHPFLSDLSFTIVSGDLFDTVLLQKYIEKCDAVIHCAALISFHEKDKEETYHVNVTGTNNILQAAFKYKKRMIFVSTTSTLGGPSEKPQIMNESDQFSFNDSTPYSYSKYIAESQVLRYVKKGLSATIVHPSSVYGAGDCHGTSHSLYTILDRYPIFFAPSGGCGVIAVEDVVNGILAALLRGKSGERYILTAENILYKDLFCMILRECKRTSLPLITIPHFIAPFGVWILKHLKLSPNMIPLAVFSYLFKYRYLDNQKAVHTLGWKPVIPIAQAIKEEYLFFREENQK